MTALLAAPLAKALADDLGYGLGQTGLAEAVKPILAALRSDPDVPAAVAEALRITAGDGTTTFEYRAGRLLDALLGQVPA